jgi:hypothetical protein
LTDFYYGTPDCFDKLSTRSADPVTGTRIDGKTDSKIQRFKEVCVPISRFKDSRIQGFKDLKIQRFKDSKIRRFKDSKIQRFKDLKIQRFKCFDR